MVITGWLSILFMVHIYPSMLSKQLYSLSMSDGNLLISAVLGFLAPLLTWQPICGRPKSSLSIWDRSFHTNSILWATSLYSTPPKPWLVAPPVFSVISISMFPFPSWLLNLSDKSYTAFLLIQPEDLVEWMDDFIRIYADTRTCSCRPSSKNPPAISLVR